MNKDDLKFIITVAFMVLVVVLALIFALEQNSTPGTKAYNFYTVQTKTECINGYEFVTATLQGVVSITQAFDEHGPVTCNR